MIYLARSRFRDILSFVNTADIQKCKYRSNGISNDVRFDAYIQALIHVDKALR